MHSSVSLFQKPYVCLWCFNPWTRLLSEHPTLSERICTSDTYKVVMKSTGRQSVLTIWGQIFYIQGYTAINLNPLL